MALDENVLNGLLLPRSSQLALFLAPGTFQTLQVAVGVKQVLSGLFSVEPTVLPSDVPVEVPRIIMQERGVGQLTVGYTRADLILEWRADQSWGNRVTALSEELTRYFVEQARLKVQRLGFVVTFAVSEDMNLEAIRSRYVAAGKMLDAEEIGIAWLCRTKVQGILVNRWVRFSISSLPGGDRSVVIDTNTLLEDQLDLDATTVKKIVETCLDQLRSDAGAILEW